MGGGHEIELKFLCVPADLDAILAAAPPGEDAVRELNAVYFDTPEGALDAQAASFRVRQEGERRVQTLKKGKGLAREEHEIELSEAEPGPDLSMPALRALLSEAELARLAPVSETRVVRRQRLVRHEGAEIEIAADLGEVRSAGRAASISELELELRSGPEAALHALAEVLRRIAPLTPSAVSKAARGRALRQS